jgi:hypothetical protein
MSKSKPSPTHGERFDRILQYLADSEGNDIELVALHEIADALWQLLTPEQESEFFERVAPLEAKATVWAGDDSSPGQLPAVNRHEPLVTACKCLLEAFRNADDLNDLPVAEVVALLTKALRQRSRPMAAHNTAINAARIAFELDRDFPLPSARLESIVAAAAILDAIEAEPGFDWENQSTDWESVCARIAGKVGDGPPQGWFRLIRRLLAPRKRCRTRRAP